MTRPLPDAIWQNPACGSCGAETEGDGDCYRCTGCKLAFDRETLEASFEDESDKPCGQPCDNTWHADDAIRKGVRFNCHPCALPEGHEYAYDHWTGCEPIE